MDEARRNADKMSSEELKLNSGSIKVNIPPFYFALNS